MVLTAAQTTLFLEGADQMAIPNGTVLELVNKGIDTVNDLSKFDKDTIGQITYNLWRPPASICLRGQITEDTDFVAFELIQ
jgi:hypothetical protein